VTPAQRAHVTRPIHRMAVPRVVARGKAATRTDRRMPCAPNREGRWMLRAMAYGTPPWFAGIAPWPAGPARPAPAGAVRSAPSAGGDGVGHPAMPRSVGSPVTGWVNVDVAHRQRPGRRPSGGRPVDRDPLMLGALLAAPAGAGRAGSANCHADHHPSVVGAHAMRRGAGPQRRGWQGRGSSPASTL